MRSLTLRATLLLLSLCFLLSQCKPKDPTPPIPKIDRPAIPSHAPAGGASPHPAPGL
jgi:hypothetical protein